MASTILAKPALAGSLITAVGYKTRDASQPRFRARPRTVRQACRCLPVTASAAPKQAVTTRVASGLAAVALSAALQFSSLAVAPASASDFAVLAEPAPLESHVVDDANVLSRITKGELRNKLTALEKETGYSIDVVTTRKIQAKSDIYAYVDTLLETWYPTLEQGDKRGILILATSQKEGAVAGGPSFNKKIGEEILESISTEQLPPLAVEEKYNEAINTSVARLVNAIKGFADTPPAARVEQERAKSNFKSKTETQDKRGVYVTVVGGLLVISFVVPMLQYFAYVRKN